MFSNQHKDLLGLRTATREEITRVLDLAEEMRQAYLAGCVGKVYPVLFEQPRDGKFSGHAPNYMEVLVEGEGPLSFRPPDRD